MHGRQPQLKTVHVAAAAQSDSLSLFLNICFTEPNKINSLSAIDRVRIKSLPVFERSYNNNPNGYKKRHRRYIKAELT
jgi:hypothetical protein